MKILIFAGVSPNTFVYMMDEAELYYRFGGMRFISCIAIRKRKYVGRI